MRKRAFVTGPGRGQVHQLAGLASIALDDYDTAWDQVIRAQQAGIDTAAEIALLRQESAAPANLEERLRAPKVYVDHYPVFDLVEQAAMRMTTRVLAQELSKEPEIGLISQEAQADYRIFIMLTSLAEKNPRRLEANLELLESADDFLIWGSEEFGGKRKYGKRLHQRHLTLSDIEDEQKCREELEPHLAELLKRLKDRQ